MLSQIVFIAFLLAVFIGNSESLHEHKFRNDQDVLDNIENFSDGTYPIILFKDMNPMEYAQELRNFINNNFSDLILFNNSNNDFLHTHKVLNHNLVERSTYPYQALFVMKDGQIIKPNRLSTFTKHFLCNLKIVVDGFIASNKKSTHFHAELSREMNQAQFPEGQPVGNPVGISPKPIYRIPQTSATLKRRYDQSQVSGQSRLPTNTQMATPMLNYQDFQMSRFSVSGEGQSSRQGQGSGQQRPHTNTQMTTPTMNYQYFPIVRSSVSGQGLSSGQGQGSGQPRPQTNTQMTTPRIDYQRFPITAPYGWLPRIPIQPTPLIQPTPRGPVETQDLLIRLGNQEGRKNNLTGSPHRENNLDGSHLTLSLPHDSHDSYNWIHTDKKSKYGGESTSFRK